jgi:hypothetical protein
MELKTQNKNLNLHKKESKKHQGGPKCTKHSRRRKQKPKRRRRRAYIRRNQTHPRRN